MRGGALFPAYGAAAKGLTGAEARTVARDVPAYSARHLCEPAATAPATSVVAPRPRPWPCSALQRHGARPCWRPWPCSASAVALPAREKVAIPPPAPPGPSRPTPRASVGRHRAGHPALLAADPRGDAPARCTAGNWGRSTTRPTPTSCTRPTNSWSSISRPSKAAERKAVTARIEALGLDPNVVGRLTRLRMYWPELDGGAVYYINEPFGTHIVRYFFGLPKNYDRTKPWPLVIKLPTANAFLPAARAAAGRRRGGEDLHRLDQGGTDPPPRRGRADAAAQPGRVVRPQLCRHEQRHPADAARRRAGSTSTRPASTWSATRWRATPSGTWR